MIKMQWLRLVHGKGQCSAHGGQALLKGSELSIPTPGEEKTAELLHPALPILPGESPADCSLFVQKDIPRSEGMAWVSGVCRIHPQAVHLARFSRSRSCGTQGQWPGMASSSCSHSWLPCTAPTVITTQSLKGLHPHFSKVLELGTLPDQCCLTAFPSFIPSALLLLFFQLQPSPAHLAHVSEATKE